MYEVGGNVSGLQNLAAEQQGYISRFKAIMDNIETVAKGLAAIAA